MLTLGDMTVMERPPAKLAKALAVIAEHLHPTFSAQPWIASPTKSKESCVLCSLAVRDFLHRIGYVDARVRSVILVIKAERDGEELHSLGIGIPGQDDEHGKWNGHAVVVLPSLGWLIDTTVYQALRPAWPELTGMVALPILKERLHNGRHRMVASASLKDGSYEAGMMWLANPRNSSWKHGGDAEPDRRIVVVRTLTEKFLPWE